ncbi:MAG: DUF3341 domain-containing protein [Calditrichaeota bacterium]|nr:DUF3341 domain-containing protein [Calditrichota bacterium]MCB9365790.1 DUF3341 domain-containing protein [Calditrichota bacterium]
MPNHAIIGVYSDPDVLLHAADGARQKGWKQLDAITPYPIHGLEKALGIGKSWVPWVTLTMGLTGAALGFLLQYWVHVIEWPMNIGGKPLNAWPAFFPIMFECGVLIGGIATFIAMWAACKLPNSKPVVHDERFTDDKFGLVIPVEGLNPADVEKYLTAHGAEEVKHV